MSIDGNLRVLERAALDGDPHAEVKLYRARLRAGEFGSSAELVARAIDVACGKSGEPCEATLEVLGLALSGELTHGSWVTIHGKGKKLLKHGHGTWWAVVYWYQGYSGCDVTNLRWMENWALCAAGRQLDRARRGHNKCVSNWSWGAHTYSFTDGLRFLADRLDLTYRPGVGLALWQARKQLGAAKGNVTRMVNKGRVGPTAYAELNVARSKVDEIEAQIKILESGE